LIAEDKKLKPLSFYLDKLDMYALAVFSTRLVLPRTGFRQL
jgi:hypothetical protein